jgi:hypothetical protein
MGEARHFACRFEGLLLHINDTLDIFPQCGPFFAVVSRMIPQSSALLHL